MATAQDICSDLGLRPSKFGVGERSYSTCPQCSAGRKTEAHRRATACAVTIYDWGVAADCNHCGWSDRRPFNGKANGHCKTGDESYVAIYDYVDETWNLLFQVCRTEKKAFPQRRPLPGGKWDYKLGDTRKVPYRLPELIAAVAAGETIYVPEGEKDVDNLWRLGLAATCNPGGASQPGQKQKWLSEFNSVFEDADVVILPDHDPPGYARAEFIAQTLRREARSVRILKLADHWPEVAAKENNDVSDGIEAGRTRDEIEALAKATPRWTPPPSKVYASIGAMSGLCDETFPPLKMIVPRYIPEGLTVLAGRPKAGKSWGCLDLGTAVSEGGTFLGQKCEQGDVLYLALEDGKPRLQRRMTTMLGAFKKEWPRRFFFNTEWPRLDEGGIDEMWNWIERADNPRLIMVDIFQCIKPGRGNSKTPLYDQDYSSLVDLRRLTKKARIGVLVTIHQRKRDAEDLVDTINATTGISGAADMILVFDWKRGEKFLYGRGRDTEGFYIGVAMDAATCRWVNLGPRSQDGAKSAERAGIIAALARKGGPMSPPEIAKAIGIASDDNQQHANLRALLSKMVSDNDLKRAKRGFYELAGETDQQPIPF